MKEIQQLHLEVHGEDTVVQDMRGPDIQDCGYLLRWAIRKAQSKGIDVHKSFTHFMDKKTGSVTTAQFEHMLREWGTDLDHKTIMKIVYHIDTDSSGSVSWVELSDYIRTTADYLALSITVIAFLFYPTVALATMQLLACRSDLEHGEFDAYLSQDLRVPCFDAQHISMLVLVGIPSAIIYIVGVPLSIFLILMRNEKRLHTDKFRFRYGMLISGYNDSYSWWEAMVAWRKAFIIMTSVIGGLLGTATQVYLSIGFLLGFLCLQMSKKPYTSALLNDMENYGLLASFLTLYLGLCYYLESLTTASRTALTVCIASVNVVYLLFVLWEILIHMAIEQQGWARSVMRYLLPMRLRLCPRHRHKNEHNEVMKRAVRAIITQARVVAVRPVAKSSAQQPDERALAAEKNDWATWS